MKRIAALFAIILVALGLAVHGLLAQPCPSMEMYQSKPPTPGADPEQQHAETFKVPLRLQIELRDGRICVQDDTTSLVAVPISVGKLMTVGITTSLFYFQGAERKKFGDASISDSYLRGILCGPDPGIEAVLRTQGFVQFIRELAVFETDLPGQHMWQPERGRYRVLWQGVAVGYYRAKE